MSAPPRHHIRPISGWLNDPNGPLRWNGRYHVFFQHNPAGPTHGDIHWGHASSADLLTWRNESVALAPTPGGPDELGCWSGCVVVDDGMPTAVYTGVRDGHLERGAICLARADPAGGDLGRFVADGPPVVEGPPPGFGATVFRDPFVFSRDGHRYAVVGAGSPTGPAVLLYTCDDLTRWEYAGVLLDHSDDLARRMAPGAGWECPQLFPIADRWVLLLSLWTDGRPERVVALVGDLIDGTSAGSGPLGLRFLATDGGPVDLGADFYAPAVLLEADRVLMWGWSWESNTPDAVLDSGWSGVLTLPREIDLDPNGRLAVRLARELPNLRGQRLAAGRWLLREHPAEVAELPTSTWVTVRCPDDAGSTRLVLRESPEAQLSLTIDIAAGTVVLDRSGWATAPARSGLVVGPLETSSELLIEVVIDGTILEIFVQNRVSITERIYPQPGERRTLTVSGTDGTTLDVEAWGLG
ncbi:MAG: glycoside hydrolase family 32 protein [Candidatus Nanopelagicales bacterium]